MLDHARNRHDAAKEKLLLKHGAKTASELNEQQNAAFPEVKPEQPEKQHGTFPSSPLLPQKHQSSLKGTAAWPYSGEHEFLL